MPFISVSDELSKKSFTSVENKFITKYMPVLEPNAVKVYLFALYIYQNGLTSYTLEDFAKELNLSEADVKNYFEYLEEFELVSLLSEFPFEVKILNADNISGSPKKFKPEKYADFSKNVQSVIKGRMISTNEYREYFLLIEEYGFEQNALIMIINYCVNLKGDNIRLQYIKKVAKSFAEEGAVTAKKVDERLSAYTSSTPALIRIFGVMGLKKQPDIDDDKLYKKWINELGFEESAITSAAKHFKIKTTEKLDAVLTELYKNKKFDVKEIEDYAKIKNSIYNATVDIARALGVYMQNPAPYIENYVNVWYDYGYSFEGLGNIAAYCFRNNKKSFEDMNDFIKPLYADGTVTDGLVKEYIEKLDADDALIKKLLNLCGLTRKLILWDRENLARWRSWNFSDAMLAEAAKLSAGKSNPIAYMNGILSAWKSEGTFSPDQLKPAPATKPSNAPRNDKAEIERHFYDLRHLAEDKAERALNRAVSDEIYGKIYREINELSIQLALAEIRNEDEAKMLSEKIAKLENSGDLRLKELGMNKADFTPKYSCKKCNDTGYDEYGSPCECMKKFIKTL
ncbi:MAG: DnaD domain protein [Ruminococcus flavefaciens]|nr:DnaD domain protein [Ruminococcus flavefaciens]